jgi:hypothetical protein
VLKIDTHSLRFSKVKRNCGNPLDRKNTVPPRPPT